MSPWPLRFLKNWSKSLTSMKDLELLEFLMFWFEFLQFFFLDIFFAFCILRYTATGFSWTNYMNRKTSHHWENVRNRERLFLPNFFFLDKWNCFKLLRAVLNNFRISRFCPPRTLMRLYPRFCINHHFSLDSGIAFYNVRIFSPSNVI